MKKIIGISLAALLFLSCLEKNNESIAKADFTYTAKSDSANYIAFKANTQGSFDQLEWVFPDENIKSKTDLVYYFPHKGTYPVTLKLWKSGSFASETKEINIAHEDPTYVPKLIWSDEFDGTSLNTAFWTNETNIDVNNEWQKYTNGDNLSLKDGILTITAYKTGPGQHKYDYTSGRIITSGKKEFLYGRMEIRAQLPKGRGTWPATWMLGANINSIGWPASGEIDIMEHVGYDPLWIQATVHNAGSYGQTPNNGRLKVEDCESAFHTYGMTWTPQKMEFYVDDPAKPYYTYNPSTKNDSNWPYNKPFFFILNLAIGGTWGGVQGVDDSIFPVEMKIDYVRVYDYK